MSGKGDLFSAWQRQQEAFWSNLTGQSDGGAGARDWFEQWSKIAGANSAFSPISAADVFAAPFRAAFGKDMDLQSFFSFPDGMRLFAQQELGEEQIRQLSDYWVGLLHLPTSKLAVEQALSGLSGMRTFYDLCKLNPLFSDPMAEAWEKIRAGWQAMLESYKDLLDLYGAYAHSVSNRLISELASAEDEIKSVKQLFDAWVLAAEAVHDEITGTSEYRQAFGRFVNELCLTVKLQRDATDAFLERIGVPTYSELTDVHARVQTLRKGQRRLRADMAEASATVTAMQAEVGRLTRLDEDLTEVREEERKLRSDLDALGKLGADLGELRKEQRKLRTDLATAAASAAAATQELQRLRKGAEEAVGLREGLATARQEVAQLRRELALLAASVDAAPKKPARRTAKQKPQE